MAHASGIPRSEKLPRLGTSELVLRACSSSSRSDVPVLETEKQGHGDHPSILRKGIARSTTACSSGISIHCIPRYSLLSKYKGVSPGAAGGARTHDLPITNRLLCQLSYDGLWLVIVQPRGVPRRPAFTDGSCPALAKCGNRTRALLGFGWWTRAESHRLDSIG